MNQQISVKEQIGVLIELQVLDGEIYALNSEKAMIPSYLSDIEATLESKRTGIKNAEDNLKNLQLKVKEKEISLQQKEEQIKKLQGQLYQLKTNKDYSAMTAEIGGIKADNSLIEEELIKLIDEVDMAKKKIAEEKELFQQEDGKAKIEKDRVNARAKEMEDRLAKLDSERQKIVPKVERQLLAAYERVLKNRDGLAVVQVEGDSCGGCNMILPPQVINDVKLRIDVVVCGSCSRILYMDENAEVN